MFTIKHFTPTGCEVLINTDEVSFTPSVETDDPNSPKLVSTGTVWWKSPNNELVPIRDGHVYVMNAHGATVAKYTLGGWDK